MTAEDINLVRDSLAHVEGRAELVALLFYKRLFELVPELQPLFGPDLEAQMEKFLQLLQTSVLLMDSPELLVPALESLGRRHAVYGLRDKHYLAIGQAFIWALGEALGRELNKDAVLAWAAFYEFLSATMQNGTVLSHARHELAAW